MSDERPPPTQRFPGTADFPTGPGIGEALPDFTLPDQRGEPVSFHSARGGQRALLVFVHATSW